MDELFDKKKIISLINNVIELTPDQDKLLVKHNLDLMLNEFQVGMKKCVDEVIQLKKRYR
jgi:hypothetical protein